MVYNCRYIRILRNLALWIDVFISLIYKWTALAEPNPTGLLHGHVGGRKEAQHESYSLCLALGSAMYINPFNPSAIGPNPGTLLVTSK
jgi:hypothetical protein